MERLLLWMSLLSAVICLFSLPQGASGLNCYTDLAGTKGEDCGMHTGCMKKYVLRTQRTVQRSCWLTPGVKDECFKESNNTGFGVCYCHTDLCNRGGRSTEAAAVAMATMVAVLVPAFVSQVVLN